MVKIDTTKIDTNKNPEIKIDKSYTPTRMTFNFSFLTPNREYGLNGKSVDKKIKAKLIDRLEFLSQKDYVAILGLSKEVGLEKLPESSVSLRKHPEFISSGRDDACNNDFWVFRLSKKGRVIGKMKDKIFFILSIDVKFDSYKHG